MVTLKEIAQRSGASINTVSRALNGKLTESWPKVAARAQAIRDMAREMGYRPNAAAQTMRNQKSHNIGVLMSGGYTLEYEMPVLIGLGEVMRGAGYALTLIQEQDCDPNHLQKVSAFRDGFLDAIFVQHVQGYLTDYVCDIFKAHVHLDSNIRLKRDCIFRDEYTSGLLTARHTAGLGHREVLYITHVREKNSHVNVVDRLKGCQDGCAEYGCQCEVLEVGFHVDQIAQAAEKLHKLVKRYRAFVTTGQSQAQWCANILAQDGLCAGRNYSLCSCEEKLDCRSVWRELSRVSFDRIDLGRQAGKMMLKKLEDPAPKSSKSVIITGEWVEGCTTCRVEDIRR